ncbi:hypothetical protein PIROE2DRAFT_51571, partial [Piromyces sp. E2]
MASKICRKIAIVGDDNSGKTCLLLVYCKGVFPKFYVPTIYDFDSVVDVNVDGKHVELALRDSSEKEDYVKLRILSYLDCNVILICFSIDSPNSLDNVTSKWYPEVLHYRKLSSTKIILVGCKKDLRNNASVIEELKKFHQKPVTYDEGKAVADEIFADYVECSALEKDGVNEVFELIARASLIR